MIRVFKLLRFGFYAPFYCILFIGTIAGRRFSVPLFEALRKFTGVVIPGVLRDFRAVFRNRIFLLGAATLSLSYIPLLSWVAVSPVILMDAGGLTTSEFAWSQVPVFSAVIIANLSVARWVKDPTRPRFVLSAVPIQMLGLAILIVGNLIWPHVWLWSVLGTCFYAFGIGLIFQIGRASCRERV